MNPIRLFPIHAPTPLKCDHDLTEWKAEAVRGLPLPARATQLVNPGLQSYSMRPDLSTFLLSQMIFPQSSPEQSLTKTLPEDSSQCPVEPHSFSHGEMTCSIEFPLFLFPCGISNPVQSIPSLPYLSITELPHTDEGTSVWTLFFPSCLTLFEPAARATSQNPFQAGCLLGLLQDCLAPEALSCFSAATWPL